MPRGRRPPCLRGDQLVVVVLAERVPGRSGRTEIVALGEQFVYDADRCRRVPVSDESGQDQGHVTSVTQSPPSFNSWVMSSTNMKNRPSSFGVGHVGPHELTNSKYGRI